MHAADLIQASIDRTGSVACIGLDPRPGLIPPGVIAVAVERFGDTVEAVAEAFLVFNRGIIDAAAGACAAVKPQVACYEAYGSVGMRCLEQTIHHARTRGIPVIADGKRNDLGSTAEHYAQGWLTTAPSLRGTPLPSAGADWLTVNGYLGIDGITPFLSTGRATTGIFVLVKTSNPSSGDLQDLALADGTVAERMARLVARWGEHRLGTSGLSDVGAVVGATYPVHARLLRQVMPDTLFLVPGYGAQGASAADALAGRRADGRGVLVNSSRAILGAWQADPTAPWADCARAAIDRMNRELRAV